MPNTMHYPPTERKPVTDQWHGTAVTDAYQWLETSEDAAVVAWTESQEALTHSVVGDLPQRAYITQRLNALWRYDDESRPFPVVEGERLFFWQKRHDAEKRIFYTRAHKEAEPEMLLNPNEWAEVETLAGIAPSRDGKLLAFGTARGGDENPVVRVMDVETGELLPDTLRGWKQYVSSWLPDRSGFFYTAKPLAGEVPAGEEEYWHAVYFHRLGTPPEEDRKVFGHDSVKEYFHGAYVTEDGRYEVYIRSRFSKNEVYFKRTGVAEALTPLATGFDAQYDVTFIGDTILIRTDANASRYEAFVTTADAPEREHWRSFISAHESDTLAGLSAIAGHIYATYQHNAHTLVKIYSLAGEYLRDLPFPTIGSGGVSGYWSKDEVWVNFSSFTYPPTVFTYDFDADALAVYKEFPVAVDVENYTSEQVWYESKDGTPVSMFLIQRTDLVRNGENPVLLTGYGGFNLSRTPGFVSTYVIWLECGGAIAIPNLRGGGEYGRAWHEAGMLARKQNVFDDFIAAAEWLIEKEYTRPERLAISGGSNGGLLVGAATVQRPELFQVVNCAVPLLDMLRYHKFGLANIWTEEYGSADEPDQFPYLYAYSPYHNVVDGTHYPAMLITAGENDARVDPMHARKMVARLQAASASDEPILLLVRKESGHGGGTTISTQIEQTTDVWAFLMDKLGMRTP